MYIVVGIIEREIIGINSSDVSYSGKNIGTISGTINIPTNANRTEKHTVRSFILVVLTPLESSGRTYFLTFSGMIASKLRICIAK